MTAVPREVIVLTSSATLDLRRPWLTYGAVLLKEASGDEPGYAIIELFDQPKPAGAEVQIG